MKNKSSIFILGIILGCSTIVGANQAIQAIQNTEIHVNLNGETQEFKDETTKERQYPITYNDRTYLPLRNIAELTGLDVDYDNYSKTAILRTKYNNYLEAYMSIVNDNINEYGKGEIQYKLVYFNNDDIPDLMYGKLGYWSNIAIYRNHHLYLPFGEFGISYGAMGKAGFSFEEKSGTIIDTDADYAGAIVGVSHLVLTEDCSTFDELHSSQLIEGIELTSEEDKQFYEEAIKAFNDYGGYYIDGKKVSKSKYEDSLKKLPKGTGETIDCSVEKSETEIYSALVDMVDTNIKNEYIESAIQQAYGSNTVSINGKQQSVYDFVTEMTYDNRNDLLKIDVENKDIQLFYVEDGEEKVGHLREDSKIIGEIKCVYLNSNDIMGNFVCVAAEQQEGDTIRKTLYKLSTDVNTNFYIENYWVKEENGSKTRYLRKSGYSNNFVDIEDDKDSFDFRVNSYTKSSENNTVKILYKVEEIF